MTSSVVSGIGERFRRRVDLVRLEYIPKCRVKSTKASISPDRHPTASHAERPKAATRISFPSQISNTDGGNLSSQHDTESGRGASSLGCGAQPRSDLLSISRFTTVALVNFAR
jgi:hypothetical protein